MSDIERRFRKELRQIDFDHKELFLIDTKTVEYKAAKELLRSVFGQRLLVRRLLLPTRKRKAVFIPSSLENELCRELRNFLEDEDDLNRFTPLLATIPEEMILAYAERHGLTGRPLAPKDGVRAMLEDLQKRQLQTKPSLKRSFDWLRTRSEEKKKGLSRMHSRSSR